MYVKQLDTDLGEFFGVTTVEFIGKGKVLEVQCFAWRPKAGTCKRCVAMAIGDIQVVHVEASGVEGVRLQNELADRFTVEVLAGA